VEEKGTDLKRKGQTNFLCDFLFLQLLVKAITSVGRERRRIRRRSRSTFFSLHWWWCVGSYVTSGGGPWNPHSATIPKIFQCASWLPNNLSNLFPTFRKTILQIFYFLVCFKLLLNFMVYKHVIARCVSKI
jgi:hypothetical protein